MKISHGFLKSLIKSKIIKANEVPIGHYHYEYAKEHFEDGAVFGTLELDNEIISDLDNKIIGYFGINYEHNIMAYYLKI